MKPANFPERRKLRQVRAAASAVVLLPPRGFDHGAASTAAEREAIAALSVP